MNEATLKIGILGMGGIGGFVGAPLAKKYKDSDTKIVFICRGKTKENIQKEGLTFETKNTKENLEGTVAVKFSDIGLEPPTKMGGIIKVKNEFVIHFNLYKL